MRNTFDRHVDNFSHFTQVKLTLDDKVVGYSITAIDKNQMPIGGGTHADLNTARRIAVAECIERSLVKRISNEPNTFLTEQYPTSCGFAAGFDDNSTRIRAICEGYERWLWEEWIDRGRFIAEVQVPILELTPLAKLYMSEFDSIRFFKHTFIPCDSFLTNTTLNLGVVIAKLGNGVFTGSRVSFGDDNLWEHGFIEAYRHLTIYKHHKVDQYSNIAHKRIFYFGNNADAAYAAIPQHPANKMCQPRIKLLKEYGLKDSSNVFLWRCICENLSGWHSGTIERFII